MVDTAKKKVPKWRLKVLERLGSALIVFELVLSVMFISLSYLTGNIYFKGVGVGLTISWVTSAIAYSYKKNEKP